MHFVIGKTIPFTIVPKKRKKKKKNPNLTRYVQKADTAVRVVEGIGSGAACLAKAAFPAQKPCASVSSCRVHLPRKTSVRVQQVHT